LDGGVINTPFFKERLQVELKYINPNANIVSLPTNDGEGIYFDNTTTVWRGSALLLRTSVMPWISKAQYEEAGPTVLHLKCF